MTDDLAADEAARALQRRVWAAAILGGHRGLGELAEALDAPGLAHSSLRTLRPGTPDIDRKLEAIAAHCQVPTWWLRHGFGGDDRAGTDADLVDPLRRRPSGALGPIEDRLTQLERTIERIARATSESTTPPRPPAG